MSIPLLSSPAWRLPPGQRFTTLWIFISTLVSDQVKDAIIESQQYQSLAGGPALPFPCKHAHPAQLIDNRHRVSSSSFIINEAPPARILQSCSMFKGAKAEGGARRSRASGVGCRASTFMDGNELRLGLDENPDAIISGEWPQNFSLISYNDFRAYLQSQQKQDAQADDQQRVALLSEAMSTPVLMVTADQTLLEVEGHFGVVSGLPVVDSARRCVGVVVKSDWTRASHGPQTKIAEVMSSPAITLSCDKTVTDAAALMLKKKIHRLPIVNQDNQVIGIVTRDDVLRALEAMLKI